MKLQNYIRIKLCCRAGVSCKKEAFILQQILRLIKYKGHYFYCDVIKSILPGAELHAWDLIYFYRIYDNEITSIFIQMCNEKQGKDWRLNKSFNTY